MQKIVRVTSVAAGLLLTAAAVADSEWTRWGGPRGDFSTGTTNLATSWSSGQPETVWERDLGDGYSGILVDGGTLYTLARRGEEEVVYALDAKTGKTRWELAYPAPLPEIDKSYGIGPRGTPTLEDGRLYTTGIGGQVHCIDVKEQKSVWSHDLVKEYGATMPRWGYSSSPLLYGDHVIVASGGKGSAIAFDKKTGKEVWRSSAEDNSYSSPMLISANGRDQVVLFLAKEVVGLDPKDGSKLWGFPHKTSWDINATMPVWSPKENLLMISSAYGTGARGLKLDWDNGETKVSEVWSQRRVGVQHGIMILRDGIVYCSIGMQGPAIFMAVRIADGEILWKKRGIAKATMVRAGEQLVVLGEDGTLHLVGATPDDFEVRGEREILGSAAWTVPTLVGHNLFARDKKKIVALKLP